MFDAVRQLARFADCGHEVIPAARDMRFGIESKNVLADGIAVVMVVEEPAIEAGIAQGRLNCVQVHRPNSTLCADAGACLAEFWAWAATVEWPATYSEERTEQRSRVDARIQVIQGRYFRDLMDQPEALRATWQSLRDTDALDAIGRTCARTSFERVVLTGMGGSFFGLHPLCIELVEHGWTPMMVETSELIHYYRHLLTPSTLVIAVSQSGKSAETVRLLEMNAHRAKVIGVTNWADSPLARDADFAVLTAAGDEYSVSCKTYVTAQMALRMLGAVLCGADQSGRLKELESTSELVADFLKGWDDKVSAFIELLTGVRDVFLVGRGDSLAAAQTSALIIKESSHFHAEGMSSAALRHGPFEMLKAGIMVGVFAGDEKARPLNEGLVRDIERTSAKALMFSTDAQQPCCRLPEATEMLRPIVEILPVQMMTLALAALANREAGKFERATKVTAIE